MLAVDLGNIYVDHKRLAPLLERLRAVRQPSFVGYKEKFPSLKAALSSFQKLSNLIVIGHGGSVTSLKALCGLPGLGRKLAVLSTNEPDAILALRRQFSRKNTLVMPISKSGSTVTILEGLMAFQDYPVIAVTEKKPSPLSKLCEIHGWKLVPHPDIGGRFSGISSSAYLPLTFMGVDVKSVDKGVKEMYAKCTDLDPEKNPALHLSLALAVLEMQGYTEVFVPVYNQELARFLPLIIQLMHESVCKNGLGQTFYGDQAPESQHHTNQRFFGGRRNVVGLLVRVKEPSEEFSVHIKPADAGIPMADTKLGILDALPYSKALDFEYQGVREHTIHYKIPYVVLTLDRMDPRSAGTFMGFWHYVAIYSSWLRSVNPFDQPEVEFSKKHSLALRKAFSLQQDSLPSQGPQTRKR